ncbi:UNVERIFIED_CONTAM: hypothetical protein PYX00_005974 [Menopon gallinae]|uniref:Ragulator complex protein LAMTOR1 n=1 Tax=Menopon gallinae TaxID=328185 RepID=A0AAW2HTC6_9NEOP
MGVCLSCCRGEESGTGNETNERTHLLADPAGNSSNNINRLQCEEYIARYPNSMPKKNDEQSALSKILHETATNVIDVSALDSHDLEQHEYYERMKAYKLRLSGLLRWLPPNQNKLLLTDVPAPEKLLCSDPISMDNFLLITKALEGVTQAVSEVCVIHKEDLVVPFRIP